MSLSSFVGNWYIYKVSLSPDSVFGGRETEMAATLNNGILDVKISARSGERVLKSNLTVLSPPEIQGRQGGVRLRACKIAYPGAGDFLFGHLSHVDNTLRRDVFVGFKEKRTGPSSPPPSGSNLFGRVLPLLHPAALVPGNGALRNVNASFQGDGSLLLDYLGNDQRTTEFLSFKKKSKGVRFKGHFLKSGSQNDHFCARTIPSSTQNNFNFAIGFSHYHKQTALGHDNEAVVNLGYPNCTDPTVIIYPSPPPLPEGEEEHGREP